MNAESEKKFSRRSFLRGGALGAAAATTLGLRLANSVRLVQIHPRTAEKSGIVQGDKIVIESPRGAITATATIWEGIREDTIFIPNSFGPAQAMGDEFGLPRYETANTLLDDRYFDNLSGQQAYKCFAVRVRKA